MKALLFSLLFVGLCQAESASSLIAKGDALDAKLQSEAALQTYLEALKLAPKDADLLIKIAKQYGESMTAIRDDAGKRKAGEAALSYSAQALQLAPAKADAHLAVAICYGRLLDLVPARTRVEYSRLVYDHGVKATQIDPRSDYAWHMLGRWNYAVATMSGLTKGLVGLVYGGLPDASLDKAKTCFEKAAKLNGNRLCHVIELGRTLAAMDRDIEAKRLIEQGLAMPDRERDDPETKQRGRATLEDL
jgi:tetratricopeptide (TPR) repeat protein